MGWENAVSHDTTDYCGGGKPVDRSNIWRQMKKLAADVGVEEGKVFLHNFRHLFVKIL